MSENIKPGGNPRPRDIPKENEKSQQLPQRPLVSLQGGTTLQQQRKCQAIKQQQIWSYIIKLNIIYDAVKVHESPFVEPSVYKKLSINCPELKLASNGTYDSLPPQPYFFDPNVRVRHRDFKTDKESLSDYRSSNQSLENMMDDPSADFESALWLCYEMNCEFREYPRLNSKGGCRRLMSQSSWRPADDWDEDGVFQPGFWDTLLLSERPSWKPVSAFVPWSDECPHVMFTLEHQVDENAKLFRGEVLAIVAAMITRLKRFASAEHIYIPVLVFSFMGNLRGRILQAFFNGTELVIKKSKLYHFASVDKARDLFQLFMRQMASSPSGSTKGLS